MKQSLLITLLSILFFVHTNAEASAMVVCEAQAEVQSITDTTVKVKVKTTKFSGGHSAGKDCRHLVGSEPEIKINSGQLKNVKVGDTIKVVHETVYNWRRDGDKVIPLVFRNWSIAGN